MRRVTCHNVEELLFEYADGAVGEPERSAVAVHLAICDACRASLELVSGVRIAVREAPLEPAPHNRRSSSIEIDVFASARRRLRVGMVAAAVAAACVAAVAFGLRYRAAAGDDLARTLAKGTRATAVQGAPARAGVVAPLTPSVDRAGRLAFEVATGTALRCDGAVVAEVLSADVHGAHFSVTAGRAVAEVGAVEPGFRFVVVTPTVEVEARGTVFSVEIPDRGATTVRVASGNVEVRVIGGSATVVVFAGEELRVGDPAPHTARLDDVIRDLAIALELGTADERPHAASDTPSPSSLGDLPATTAAEVAAASDTLVAAIAGARARLSAFRGGSSPDHLLELAQAYRRASMFDDAALTYARLVAEHPRSEIGLGSLVALAQLESLVLGKDDAARAHYAAYLKAAPHGPLASVARQGLAASGAD